MSAVTQNEYTGNGNTATYSFTFPYLKESDIKVSLDSVVTTDFSLPNATTIQFNTAPASGVKIKIFRETSVDNLTATFYAGSAIKSEDLNDNFTQNLFVTQEVNQRAMSSLGATMTGELQIGTQGSLKFEGSTDDANETTIAVTDPTADRTITFPNETGNVIVDTLPSAKIFVGNSSGVASEVDVTGDIAISNTGATTIQENAVETSMIGTDQVTTNEVDGSLVDANIASDASIAVNKLANGTSRQILQTAANGTDVEFTSDVDLPGTLQVNGQTDLNTTTNVSGDFTVFNSGTQKFKVSKATGNTDIKGTLDVHGTTGIIAADVTSGVTKVLVETGNDNQIKHGDGASIRTFINVEDGATADQTAAEIKTAYESNSDTNAYTDTEKTFVNAITATAAELNYVDGVTSDIQTQLDGKQGLDSELTTLAGMQSGTASKLASTQTLTADIDDINIVDGMTKQTGSGLTNVDTSFPTSAAVVSYVAGQIAPLGGLEVVATDAAFPYTQPASGVVISISDAGGVAFNGSGTSTTGRTVTGPSGEAVQTVTINNAPSSLNNETLVAGVGLMVSSTGSGQIYNYHKILGKEDDIKQLSDDINDFNARYRVGTASDLTGLASGTLDGGDLFFNTTTGKLLVYNNVNTAWEEAQSIGNFFISTLSPAFDGSTQDFTITNAPTTAQQILLSINGVVQKPNSGTSTPSEGFALSGSTVKLGAAPASGSIYHAVVLGSTVNIGTPSDNTVDTDILMSGAVTNEKVSSNTSDRIAGSKITPDFGSQNLSTTGTAATGALTVTGAIASTGNIEITNNAPGITFTDSDDSHQFYIQTNGDALDIVDATNSTTKIGISNTGHITLRGNVTVNDGYLEVANANLYINENITHAGDGDTRIRFPAADNISLETAGSEKFLVQSTGQINHNGPLIFTKNNQANPYDSSLQANDGAIGVRGDMGSGNYWGWRQRYTADGSVSNTNAIKRLPSINDFQYPNKSDGMLIASTSKIGFAASAESPLYANGVQMLFDSNGLALGSGNAFDCTHGSTTSANANVVIRTNGNIVFKNGAGIDFSATADATGKASELLDDYEEGSWTPAWKASGTDFDHDNNEITYNSSTSGRYVKIGKQVTVWMYIQIATINTSNISGAAEIINLPFTAQNGPTAVDGATLNVNYYTGMNGMGSNVPCGYVELNQSEIRCHLVGGNSQSPWYATYLGVGGLYASATYMAA